MCKDGIRPSQHGASTPQHYCARPSVRQYGTLRGTLSYSSRTTHRAQDTAKEANLQWGMRTTDNLQVTADTRRERGMRRSSRSRGFASSALKGAVEEAVWRDSTDFCDRRELDLVEVLLVKQPRARNPANK